MIIVIVSLHQNISELVAFIWKNANRPVPTILKPEDSGWKMKDGMYTFLWFECDRLPKDICNRIRDDEILAPDNEDNEVEEVSSDDSEYDSD